MIENDVSIRANLMLLKDFRYCDAYEAAYLYGCANKDEDLWYAKIKPDSRNTGSTIDFESVDRSYVIRRPDDAEYVFRPVKCSNITEFLKRPSIPGLDEFTMPGRFYKKERVIVDFLVGDVKRLQGIEKNEFTIFEALFFPLPSKVWIFPALLDIWHITGYPEYLRLFDFRDLCHEVIFSNKMDSRYCELSRVNPCNGDEYFDHQAKVRNLVVQTVAYYLFNEHSELKWNLNAVVNHPIMKAILTGAYIPTSNLHRVLREEVKRIVPMHLIRRGAPRPNQWTKRERAESPLLFCDAAEKNLSETYIVNYQALRIIVRAIVLAKTLDHSLVKAPIFEDVLDYPLIQSYISKLTSRSVEFVHAEIKGFIKFIPQVIGKINAGKEVDRVSLDK